MTNFIVGIKLAKLSSTVKSKQEKFPTKNLSSAFNYFDWLRSWIEAADWLMHDGAKIQNFLWVP